MFYSISDWILQYKNPIKKFGKNVTCNCSIGRLCNSGQMCKKTKFLNMFFLSPTHVGSSKKLNAWLNDSNSWGPVPKLWKSCSWVEVKMSWFI